MCKHISILHIYINITFDDRFIIYRNRNNILNKRQSVIYVTYDIRMEATFFPLIPEIYDSKDVSCVGNNYFSSCRKFGGAT